jgi:hypothetical protein
LPGGKGCFIVILSPPVCILVFILWMKVEIENKKRTVRLTKNRHNLEAVAVLILEKKFLI